MISSSLARRRDRDQPVGGPRVGDILALHLLQISLVCINTLMIQQVLTDQVWWERMHPEDLRALTPLIYAHINPYGTFELDMQKRIHLTLLEPIEEKRPATLPLVTASLILDRRGAPASEP